MLISFMEPWWLKIINPLLYFAPEILLDRGQEAAGYFSCSYIVFIYMASYSDKKKKRKKDYNYNEFNKLMSNVHF